MISFTAPFIVHLSPLAQLVILDKPENPVKVFAQGIQGCNKRTENSQIEVYGRVSPTPTHRQVLLVLTGLKLTNIDIKELYVE